MVNITVEYCGTCGYLKQYEELSKYLLEKNPGIQLKGQEGRSASFEVTVDGNLVHSKLKTMAYPDYDDLLEIVKEVSDGKGARTCKQQPITSCTIA